MTDDWIRSALEDAVHDIEPDHALASIHARTTKSPRRGLVPAAVVAAGLLVAGTVTAVALATNGPQNGAGPSGTPPTTPALHALSVYLVGDTPQGKRLYREFEQLADPAAAANSSTHGLGQDPDYYSLWGHVDVRNVRAQQGRIVVDVSGDLSTSRPTGMSRFDARLALQQVVYTTQGALGSTKPVLFVSNGARLSRLFGLDVTRPVNRASQLRYLALVNITDPSEGTTVTTGSLKATGLANSFEATVPWQIVRGATVIKQGAVTAAGAYDKLYPWHLTVDVSKLKPGTYTLVVTTDDPSSGEGGGPTRDTRTFRIP